MSPAGVVRLVALVVASGQAGLNHLADHLGSRRRLAVVGAAVAAGFLVLDLLTYRALDTFLGELLAVPGVRARILPVLPVLLAVPSFAVSLIVSMVMPVSSALALQARIAGVSRWVVGVAEFAPFAAMAVVVACGTQAGAILFLAGLSPSPATAALGLLLLDSAFALLCPVIILLVQRVFGVFRIPAYESRWLAVLVATASAGAGLLDLLRWATASSRTSGGASFLARLGDLWGGGTPDSARGCLTLLGVVVLLATVGCLLASSDAAGGYLARGRPLFRLPARGGSRAALIAAEVAQWVRDPTARVSLVCTLAGDLALVWAVRSGAVDPGIAVVLLTLLSASGAELLIGRTNPGNWMLVAAGLESRSIALLRCGPVLAIMGAAFVGTLLWSGAAGGDPLRAAEAMSLGAAVAATAVVAGAIFPFDPRAPLAMVGTAVVALVLEVALLVVVTGILRVAGWPLVAIDVVSTLISVPVVVVAFDRRLAGRPRPP